MTIVLTDQEIDRAEAFRLAKKLHLPLEVALSGDPGVHGFIGFQELFGISDTLVMRRITSTRIHRGMASAISSSDATYADRLSHVLDLGDPVSFVDLREVLRTPTSPAGIQPPGFPPDPPSASADAVPGAAEAERPAEPGQGGPTDILRWGLPGAPGAGVGLPGRQPGANPFQTLSGDPRQGSEHHDRHKARRFRHKKGRKDDRRSRQGPGARRSSACHRTSGDSQRSHDTSYHPFRPAFRGGVFRVSCHKCEL